MTKANLSFQSQHFTELTDSQWEIIKLFVDDGRKRKNCLRATVNAILKITRLGFQWRNMDENYPPWQSVFYYFNKWKKNGVWKDVLAQLVEKQRVAKGRDPQPSACAVDSQSVKIGPTVSADTGIDGGKKINGRKRHICVDALGLPLAVHVSAANAHDGDAGVELLWQIEERSKRMSLIRADHAYGGHFKECARFYNWEVEITQKPESAKGFVPQKGRWQVERSFAWLNFYRRLAKDFEKTTQSSVAFIQIAFINIILAKF